MKMKMRLIDLIDSYIDEENAIYVCEYVCDSYRVVGHANANTIKYNDLRKSVKEVWSMEDGTLAVTIEDDRK